MNSPQTNPQPLAGTPIKVPRTGRPFQVIVSGYPVSPLVCALIMWLTVGISALALATADESDSDDVSRIRNKLADESKIWVGQKVTFQVDLLARSFFSGTAVFDLPRIPGAIVMKAEGSPVVSSENIEGQNWNIQTHSFYVYPQRPGGFEIPSFPVRFSVTSEPGKPATSQRQKTEPMAFAANMPPGAEGQSLLISTSELVVEEEWKPPISDNGAMDLTVGDAVERKITLRARDVPGMVLPSMRMPDQKGVSVYQHPASVRDQGNRGETPGFASKPSPTFVRKRARFFCRESPFPGGISNWKNFTARRWIRLRCGSNLRTHLRQRRIKLSSSRMA